MGVKRVPHAPRVGDPDVLVDLQGLPQMRGGPGPVTAEKAAADPFQGACFLQRRANLTGDGEGLMVVAGCLLGRRRPQRQLAEAVQRLGQALPVA